MTKQNIKEFISNHGMEQLFFQFIDLEGNLLTKTVLSSELLRNRFVSWHDGLSIDGSEVFKTDNHKLPGSDWLLIIPDISTLKIIPIPNLNSCSYICSIKNCDYDPKSITKKAFDSCKSNLNMVPFVGSKLSFSVHGKNIPGKYISIPNDRTQKIRQKIVLSLNQVGIDVEYHYSLGTTKGNIDFVPNDLIKSADNMAFSKFLIKNISNTNEIVDFSGNLMPTHLSLWKDNKNMFFDPHGENELSDIGTLFLKGILTHYASIVLFSVDPSRYEQIKNEYYLSYSTSKDGSIINIPMYYEEKKKIDRQGWSKRIVFYPVHSNTNAHLVYSMLIAAGIDGAMNNKNLSIKKTKFPPIKQLFVLFEKEKNFIIKNTSIEVYSYYIEKWKRTKF